MVTWSAMLVIQVAALAFFLAPLFEELRDLDLDDPDTTGPGFGASQSLASIPLNVCGLVSSGALIVLAIWSYNGSKAMEATGHRTERSAGWAAAGWFIPIVSLWFPYQAVRDLVPVGHPMRPRVGWWWACWLLSGLTAFAPAVGSWFSLGAGLLAALLPITLAVAGGMLGHRIAVAAGEGFDELARKVGTWSG
jgi:hypothetical protein